MIHVKEDLFSPHSYSYGEQFDEIYHCSAKERCVIMLQYKSKLGTSLVELRAT